MKHKIRFLIGILVSLIFIMLIIKKVDLGMVFQEIKQMKVRWILYFVLLSIFNYYIKGFRWRVLALESDSRLETSFRFTRFFVIGLMSNNILPLRMGDVLRSYVVAKRFNIKKGLVVGSVIVERIFDMLSIFLLMLLFFLTSSSLAVPDVMRKFASWGLIIVVLGFVCVIIISRLKDAIIYKIDTLHNIKILKRFTRFLHSIMEGFFVLNHNHHIIRLIFLSLLAWFIEGATYFLIGQAFGFNLGIFPYIFIMITICLGTMIPSGPGYIGVFEGACVGALLLFGIAKETATAYALVIHGLQIILITTVGIFYSFREDFSFKDFKINEG
ncbi:lysylphosphatidylglycerol synthase transmembrane domain-containing protein [bacterium]